MFSMNIFPLNYQNAYGHRTFQDGDIPWGASTHKFAWHINKVVLWGHVTIKIHLINNFHFQKTYEHQTRQDANLLSKAPTLKPTWSFDHVINMSILRDLWSLNLAGCWLQGGGLARKRLSRYRNLVEIFNAQLCNMI